MPQSDDTQREHARLTKAMILFTIYIMLWRRTTGGIERTHLYKCNIHIGQSYGADMDQHITPATVFSLWFGSQFRHRSLIFLFPFTGEDMHFVIGVNK